VFWVERGLDEEGSLSSEWVGKVPWLRLARPRTRSRFHLNKIRKPCELVWKAAAGEIF